MTMPGRRTLNPPPLPISFAQTHPDLAKLIEELARHRAERSTVRQKRMTLENSESIARQRDLVIETEAFRAGKPDPGSPNVGELHRQIDPLERRERGLQLAIAATERDLLALHAAHGAELAIEAHARVVAEREAAVDALAALRTAVQGVADAERLDAWCRGGKSLPVNVSLSSNRLRTSLIPIVDALDRIGRSLVVREPEANTSEPETEAEAVA